MEAEFVNWLNKRVSPDPRVPVGIGDDAAVVLADGASIVVAADLLCDGVHFVSDDIPLEWIGRKALAVNLSDMAAMAAKPLFAVVSLLWPANRPWQDACRVYEGLLELAAEFDVALVGGDTNRWNGSLVIDVTVMGRPTGHGVWTRGGARLGDRLLVTGPLGGSLAGHHFHFQPRVSEAIALGQRFPIHAAMDLSDGLLLDLSRMMTASGVGAALDLEAVPISAAARSAAAAPIDNDDRSPLDHALTDGEDFELLLATDQDTAAAILACASADFPSLRPAVIGAVIPQSGVFRMAGAELHPIPIAGYWH